MTEAVTTSEPIESVEITDVDQFVSILMQWHKSKVEMLMHMLIVPEGTEMTQDDGTSIVLTGDALAGFKAGITLSLMELGELPFVEHA